MAATELTTLQTALLGAKHAGNAIEEAATVAYWMDGRAETTRNMHIGWLIEAYDDLAPHIDALRTLQAVRVEAA